VFGVPSIRSFSDRVFIAWELALPSREHSNRAISFVLCAAPTRHRVCPSPTSHRTRFLFRSNQSKHRVWSILKSKTNHEQSKRSVKVLKSFLHRGRIYSSKVDIHWFSGHRAQISTSRQMPELQFIQSLTERHASPVPDRPRIHTIEKTLNRCGNSLAAHISARVCGQRNVRERNISR
jgi:hypothetical protein